MKRLILFLLPIAIIAHFHTRPLCAQQTDPSSGTDANQPLESQLRGATIVDYDPSTQVGDAIFGAAIADNSESGLNSHLGPVCFQYQNGDIVAFYSNTNGHDLKGWTEYALSKDDGKTWDTGDAPEYNQFVLYQSDDGFSWNEGLIVSSDKRFHDGYSHNCIVRNSCDGETFGSLMVQYSITHDKRPKISRGLNTSAYAFFVRPENSASEK